MKKLTRRVLASVVVAGIALVASCSSPFDQGSSLGDQILRDSDPRITDPGATVKVTKLHIPVTSQASARLPSLDTIQPGLHPGRQSDLVVGKVQGMRSVAYIEFSRVVSSVGIAGKYTALVGAELVLRPKASIVSYGTSAGPRIMVAGDKQKNHKNLVDPAAYADSLTTAGQLVDSLADTASATGAITYQYKRIVSPINLSEPFTASIARACSLSVGDTTAVCSTGFVALINPGDTGFVRFSTPSIRMIFSHPDGDSLDTIETYCSYADFSVFENDSAVLDPQTTSSAGSDRKTVLALDLSPIWDSLAVSTTTTGEMFQSILEAYVDITIGNVRVHGGDSIFFKYVLLDSYNPDVVSSPLREFPRDRGALFFADGLRDSTLHLPFGEQLQRMVTQGKKPTAYLYLVAASQNGGWGWIDWDVAAGASLQVQAVFSNPQ